MSQEIRKIRVEDLVLWTENPRDPIEPTAKDQDVVIRAVSDPNNKWELNKLAREMGEYYDYSELPIVVYKQDKPIVYDGNRRVVLAKIKLGYVKVDNLSVLLPDVPNELPCNVCSEDIALKSIYRKHVTLRNTWSPLERDIFASKYLGEDKSVFLRFDEATNGFITKNPEMNQGFVRKEILTESLLDSMGFELDGEHLKTRHSDEEANTILSDLLNIIKNKQITTRVNRGNPISVLPQRSKEIIGDNKRKSLRTYHPLQHKDETNDNQPTASHQRKTPITRKNNRTFFGEKLILKYVKSNKKSFSPNIYSIFRMSLRLLCETAYKDLGYDDIRDYLKTFFADAKKKLSQDDKTFLREQNITQETLPQLFHTGAHNYQSSTSADKSIAISIILGAILRESHGKQN